MLPVETNIVIFDLDDTAPTAAAVFDRLLQKGVRTGVFGERTIRIVSHLGVDQSEAELLCDCLDEVLN